MSRRALMLSIACAAFAPVAAGAQSDWATRERQLEAWWARQQEKEQADRFWNGPRERRRNLTRDQIDRWEYERGYRGLGPSGVAGPNGQYGRYRRFW